MANPEERAARMGGGYDYGGGGGNLPIWVSGDPSTVDIVEKANARWHVYFRPGTAQRGKVGKFLRLLIAK